MAVTSPGFDRENAWAQRFMKILGETPKYSSALQTLEQQGIRKKYILHTLYYYADPKLADLSDRRKELAQEARDVLVQCKSDIDLAATALNDRLKSLYSDGEVSYYLVQLPIHANAIQTTLSSLSKYLSDISEQLKKAGWRRSAGRNENLLLRLLLTVQQRTGRKHHGNVAYLVEAAFEAHGRRAEFDADGIRHIEQRFKKSSPHQFEAYKRHIEAIVEPYQVTPSPKTEKKRPRRKPPSGGVQQGRYIWHGKSPTLSR